MLPLRLLTFLDRGHIVQPFSLKAESPEPASLHTRKSSLKTRRPAN